jgi:hypothetical protein
MEFNKQKSVLDSLAKYDYCANSSDYISISQWSNGEGYDIDINGKQMLHLTVGELDAISYLTKTLEYHRDEQDEDNEN